MKRENLIKPKLGVDLDDILLNLNEGLCTYYNARFGTTYTRNDTTSFYIEEMWGTTKEKAQEILDEYFLSEEHKASLPVPGAREGVAKLSKEYDLIIVTARSEALEIETKRWVNLHFPHMIRDIIFANHVGPHAHKARSKADICRELDIKIFIEDAAHNAEPLAEADVQVYLLDTPWNQKTIIHKNIIRVFSWNEIVIKITR